MIQYNPKDAVLCWPKGDYNAELVKVEEKTSKVKPDGTGGNPMWVLTWRVFNQDGGEQLISDYVVVPQALFKIRQLAAALGKRADFDAGNFDPCDQIGAGVIAALEVEEQPGFDEKNKVAKVKPFASESQTAPQPAQPARAPSQRPPRAAVTSPIGNEPQFTDDSIPFAWSGRDTQPV